MEHKHKATLFFTFFFLSAASLAAGSAMAAKVYRWVDENGEVYYSEKLPPDFEDKKHDELDHRGIVQSTDSDPGATATSSKIQDRRRFRRFAEGLVRYETTKTPVFR